MKRYAKIAVLLAPLLASVAYSQHKVPHTILARLPKGFAVFTALSGDFNADKRLDYVVVLRELNERGYAKRGKPAPRRPLLVFMQATDGKFELVARNERIVFAADEGGQCDPFDEAGPGLAVKGRFFTVQNGVACGQHWTDYYTFKYSAEDRNFLFHSEVFESWIPNPSNDPDAEAMIRGASRVVKGSPDKPVLLGDYKPPRP
jgi:hypothetical protein